MAATTPSPDPAPDRIDLRILQALRRVIRAVDLYSHKLYGAHKVTGPQLLALDTLRAQGPLSPAALSRALHVSASTVTGIADRLESKGLIARRRDTADRRVNRLHLTDSGQQLLASAPSPLQDTLVRRLAALPLDEQRALAESLERVVDLMKAEDVDAAPILADGAIAADPPRTPPAPA